MKKSEIFYLDDRNNIVDKSVATHSIIREYDEKGNLINEIFSQNKNTKKIRIKSYDEYTEKEKQFLASLTDKDGNHIFDRKK